MLVCTLMRLKMCIDVHILDFISATAYYCLPTSDQSQLKLIGQYYSNYKQKVEPKNAVPNSRSLAYRFSIKHPQTPIFFLKKQTTLNIQSIISMKL